MQNLPSISVIVPTLNEEGHIGALLESLKQQSHPPYEVIVADGGSTDGTSRIASEYGCQMVVRKGLKEFPSRTLGAQQASGDITLFTGADVVFPPHVLGNIAQAFRKDAKLLAIGGPGIPIKPPTLLGLEFAIYNLLRYLVAKLPKPLKRFSTSTNLLAMRRETFQSIPKEELDRLGWGEHYDVNADGNLGARLCASGKTYFGYRSVRVYMSSRRLNEMGFIGSNRHFLYVLENFLPFLSRTSLLKRSRKVSADTHSDMRKAGGKTR